jgi:hypothetical protein
VDWKPKNNPKLQFSTSSNQKTSFVPDVERPPFDEWDPTRWIYRETTFDDFVAGTFRDLIAKLPGSVVFPDEYGWCFGPAIVGDTRQIDQEQFYPYSERLWVVWKNNANQFWIGKSNSDSTEFEFVQQLLFVSSGANNPSITFDKTGHYALAVDLIPAGGTQQEAWILEYPYTGGAVRFIDFGMRPKVFMDHEKDTLYFYSDETDDCKTVYYRNKNDGYGTKYTLPLSVGGSKTINSIRFYYYGPTEKPDRYLAAMITYRTAQEKMTRYLLTSVLVDRPNPEIPPEYDLIQEYAADIYDFSARLAGIEWEEATFINRSASEDPSMACIVSGIEWEFVGAITKQLSENPNMSALLQGIAWYEITFVNKSRSENHGQSVTLQNILWIQVS